MNRPVFWAATALEELDRSIGYIAERNPSAARRVLAGIREAAERLGAAATGRRGRVSGTYEKVVAGRPYIVAYTFRSMPSGGESVIILHVIHSARDWPEGGWPGP
ncbi:type II toxin-antitoxin system RelE/ParE family toxin [Roseococcus sp. SYP-B2431]|uniref:type II toxin-antitoxin system RelE/ParE family toxin n=1 Tax=Roseococcus sp. SYP-B2431 TaxID=2496640 RepID=UPI0010396657|nr:type II toxin-antitoxin system RelE/ParE family toxin [Roseococcus sp. SYP-B2431]TCH98826.1 type II toxin-antitoxin system RelE/ParE family toxin [Roseococcus sp. SYP-B2431]